ncbi:MAG TPA: N-6 DNA methylase [Parafilimonas sp.]|nr:N-6 DNA methylase [Parafilimonas sp.]
MMDMQKMLSLFDHYARHQDNFIALEKLLDTFLFSFRIHDTPEEREKAFHIINGFKEKEAIAGLLEEIGNLSEGFNDPLGELYMQRISRGKQGQFFTPIHICDFMAAITFGDLQAGQSVLDPACGSGRMLLSAAKQNRKVQLYGADIDGTCAKMAVMNMLLHSLTGEIAHMDSLSNRFYSCYRIGTIPYEGAPFPCYRWFTDPGESTIAHHAKRQTTPSLNPFTPQPPGTGQQGSLF